jgi:hypothetical protein
MSPARRASAAADRLGVTKREQGSPIFQEIERLQRAEEAIVVATGAARARPPAMGRAVCQGPRGARGPRSPLCRYSRGIIKGLRLPALKYSANRKRFTTRLARISF